MEVPGDEAAAVVPLNLFDPDAIPAVNDTSFHGSPVFNSWIFVRLPLTWPVEKFAVRAALPSAYAL